MDQRQMRELPLNGRNFQQLIYLAPGVQVITSTAPIGWQGKEESMSAAGSRPEGQAILLDDEDLQNFYRRGVGTVTGTSLGVEAIAEFQTLTNTYSAQFGGNGVVINSVSKSGTNTFHGSAYDFLRNSAMDARSPFDPGKQPAAVPQESVSAAAWAAPSRRTKCFSSATTKGSGNCSGKARSSRFPTPATAPPRASVTNPDVRKPSSTHSRFIRLPTYNLNAAAGTGQYTSRQPDRA